MSEASDALDDINSKLETTESSLDSIANKAKSIAGNFRSWSPTGGPAGGGEQLANKSSSTTGGPGGGGNGGSAFGMDVGGLPDFKDPETRRSRRQMLGILGGGALELAGGVSAMLPSTQEAMTIDTLANRLRFYGNTQAASGIGGAFGMQRALANLGTPINALDPAAAANAGAGMGLLPGLSNYGASSQFTGILGGAALASNLTPGLGLQGGMAAMAGMNTARNVNMLRMIGVSVRNNQGQMNDLPDIIGQIFRILENSAGKGNVTPEAIAVSAMSGNALDSILNQYFGNDSALRQTVLSGLLQMANTGGTSLRYSGSKEAGIKTGAISAPVASLAGRNAAEQNMLQQWASATNTGFMGANTLLSKIFTGAANAASSTGTIGSSLQGIQAGVVGMETLGGARGGAGGLITDAILGTANGLLGNSLAGQLTKFGGVGAALLYAGKNGFGSGTPGQGINPNVSPGGSTWTPPTNSQVPAYAVNNMTINVTAPTGSDPYAFATQINQALLNTARS